LIVRVFFLTYLNTPKTLSNRHAQLVLAANLICRLPRPTAFLERCSSLVAPGGVLVLTTPYTWLSDYTPKSEWLGGYLDADGNAVHGFEGIRRVLSKDFELVREKELVGLLVPLLMF
jgi:2-polyprenyl-3-methyl-5-hydroxy-6-metoxy-1,4-benzoquinol methylase